MSHPADLRRIAQQCRRFADKVRHPDDPVVATYRELAREYELEAASIEAQLARLASERARVGLAAP